MADLDRSHPLNKFGINGLITASNNKKCKKKFKPYFLNTQQQQQWTKKNKTTVYPLDRWISKGEANGYMGNFYLKTSFLQIFLIFLIDFLTFYYSGPILALSTWSQAPK